MSDTSPTAMGRLDLLLSYLRDDPDNPSLLHEAADAALAEKQPEMAAELLERRAALGALPIDAAHTAGLAALSLGAFEKAADYFNKVLAQGGDQPSVRFSLAWAMMMARKFETALEFLDDEVTRELGDAAALKVQLLHNEGDVEAARAAATALVAFHPDHRGLRAAMSVLALDLEDRELALDCARKAGDHPDALATLGAFALEDQRATDAADLFDQALARNDANARAWVGRGLSRLMIGQPEAAGTDIDRGAEIFGDHLGSWIAAGWAYFIVGDYATARARFETALNIDPTFAESHGSLAVLEVLAGEKGVAKERCEIALRLDRNCYSAALARALLATNEGHSESARRIVERALDTSLDERGRTIGQVLAQMGMRFS